MSCQIFAYLLCLQHQDRWKSDISQCFEDFVSQILGFPTYNQNTKKSYYNSAKNISKRMAKNRYFSFLCNHLVINNLHYYLAKHAYLHSKRALVRPQKGIFCKLVGHLLEAKRPCVVFMVYEKNNNRKSISSLSVARLIVWQVYT